MRGQCRADVSTVDRRDAPSSDAQKIMRLRSSLRLLAVIQYHATSVFFIVLQLRLHTVSLRQSCYHVRLRCDSDNVMYIVLHHVAVAYCFHSGTGIFYIRRVLLSAWFRSQR